MRSILVVTKEVGVRGRNHRTACRCGGCQKSRSGLTSTPPRRTRPEIESEARRSDHAPRRQSEEGDSPGRSAPLPASRTGSRRETQPPPSVVKSGESENSRQRAATSASGSPGGPCPRAVSSSSRERNGSRAGTSARPLSDRTAISKTSDMFLGPASGLHTQACSGAATKANESEVGPVGTMSTTQEESAKFVIECLAAPWDALNFRDCLAATTSVGEEVLADPSLDVRPAIHLDHPLSVCKYKAPSCRMQEKSSIFPKVAYPPNL